MPETLSLPTLFYQFDSPLPIRSSAKATIKLGGQELGLSVMENRSNPVPHSEPVLATRKNKSRFKGLRKAFRLLTSLNKEMTITGRNQRRKTLPEF